MPLPEQEDLARQLYVNLVQHPSKYLGINFNLRGNRVADFQFLADKLHSKLEGWKANLLSQAGRTTLVNSVLQTLPSIPSLVLRFLKQYVGGWIL